MNITFMIGNGFDMGLGLRTDYGSFYAEYCKIKDDDNLNIKNFKEMLSSRLENDFEKVIDWSDFEKAFGQHSKEFDIDKKSDYIERFEDFVIKFNEYLENVEKLVDYDQTDLIVRTMQSAVTTYFHIRNGDRETIENLYNTKSGGYMYYFITFNYTKSIDRCASLLRQHLRADRERNVGKVVHIHGFTEENMIMGVNDVTQIANPVFTKDQDIIREIVKPIQNSNVRSNYEKQALELIEKSDIICIYGMSIGETDKKWWENIAEWLAQNDEHILVILKYDKDYTKRFPFTQVKYTDAVIEHFLELSGKTKEVKAFIRSRIFIGMNHNIFEMKLRKKPEELKDIRT